MLYRPISFELSTISIPVRKYLIEQLDHPEPDAQSLTVYAIVNNRLSALELAITLDMGHDGWASDVTLGNIHEVFFVYILFSVI